MKSERVPLLEVRASLAQQRLWFLAQREGGNLAYRVSASARLLGALDRAALQRALDHIVLRHESLRTCFYMKDGELAQAVFPARLGLSVQVHDLSTQPEAREGLRAIIEADGLIGFDLERGPLIRALLIRMSAQEHVLALAMHHIVSDGWSMSILLAELRAY